MLSLGRLGEGQEQEVGEEGFAKPADVRAVAFEGEFTFDITTARKEPSMSRTYHIHHVQGQHITREMRVYIETVYNRNLREPKKTRLSFR